MKAKNKALELIEKYNNFAHSNPAHDSELFYRRLKENSVACALIAVEEILETRPSYKYWDTYDDETLSAITFWNDVKSELEALK